MSLTRSERQAIRIERLRRCANACEAKAEKAAHAAPQTVHPVARVEVEADVEAYVAAAAAIRALARSRSTKVAFWSSSDTDAQARRQAKAQGYPIKRPRRKRGEP